MGARLVERRALSRLRGHFASVLSTSPDAIGAELARAEMNDVKPVATSNTSSTTSAVPVILFAARAIEDRRQAFVAGHRAVIA